MEAFTEQELEKFYNTNTTIEHKKPNTKMKTESVESVKNDDNTFNSIKDIIDTNKDKRYVYVYEDILEFLKKTHNIKLYTYCKLYNNHTNFLYEEKNLIDVFNKYGEDTIKFFENVDNTIIKSCLFKKRYTSLIEDCKNLALVSDSIVEQLFIKNIIQKDTLTDCDIYSIIIEVIYKIKDYRKSVNTGDFEEEEEVNAECPHYIGLYKFIDLIRKNLNINKYKTFDALNISKDSHIHYDVDTYKYHYLNLSAYGKYSLEIEHYSTFIFDLFNYILELNNELTLENVPKQIQKEYAVHCIRYIIDRHNTFPIFFNRMITHTEEVLKCFGYNEVLYYFKLYIKGNLYVKSYCEDNLVEYSILKNPITNIESHLGKTESNIIRFYIKDYVYEIASNVLSRQIEDIIIIYKSNNMNTQGLNSFLFTYRYFVNKTYRHSLDVLINNCIVSKLNAAERDCIYLQGVVNNTVNYNLMISEEDLSDFTNQIEIHPHNKLSREDFLISSEDDYVLINNSNINTKELITNNVGTSRFSGVEWYDRATKASISIIGLGGIGSIASILVARLNPKILSIRDFDYVEAGNLSGQFFSFNHLGLRKPDAVLNNIRDLCFTNDTDVQRVFDRYIQGRKIYPITICGFDNMEARKDVFNTWKELHGDNPEAILIDGRLTIDECQVFAISGGDKYSMDKYEAHYLFDDSDADTDICSLKQTTYMASMVGSLITNVLVNFFVKCEGNMLVEIPFKTAYDSKFMLLKTE